MGIFKIGLDCVVYISGGTNNFVLSFKISGVASQNATCFGPLAIQFHKCIAKNVMQKSHVLLVLQVLYHQRQTFENVCLSNIYLNKSMIKWWFFLSSYQFLLSFKLLFLHNLVFQTSRLCRFASCWNSKNHKCDSTTLSPLFENQQFHLSKMVVYVYIFD